MVLKLLGLVDRLCIWTSEEENLHLVVELATELDAGRVDEDLILIVDSPWG